MKLSKLTGDNLKMTNKKTWGATREQWKFFAELGLKKDLLPVVCNPGAPISPLSKMKKVGKTPSVYNTEGFVVGLGKWTEKETTTQKYNRWSSVRDYGLCIQTRNLRAVDIDVPDAKLSRKIATFVFNFFTSRDLPCPPMRYRENSGKCLIAFYVPGEIPKSTLKVEGGIVEFLGNGQQFVAAGLHDSGVPYVWNWSSGKDEPFPKISEKRYARLISELEKEFGLGEAVQGGIRNKGKGDRRITDETIKKLADKGVITSYGPEGQGFFSCPFKDGHTQESVESATAYFPAGGRGYAQGHFKCLHAHCADRTDDEFLDAFGLRADDFDDVTSEYGNVPKKKKDKTPAKKKKSKGGIVSDAEEDDTVSASDLVAMDILPPFERDKAGAILPSINNMMMALQREDICGYRLAFDDFKNDYMIAMGNSKIKNGWRALADNDYTQMQLRLENGGFLPLQFDALKRTVKMVANENVFDSAQLWLSSLPDWDGVARLDRFMPDYFGTKDDEYNRAMGRYIWTALAGRIIEPGVKADMAPVFVGAQGTFKSTAVQLLSPSEDFFATISFDDRAADNARLMRGKLVIEMDELRGLNGRDSEFIKSFIARRKEEWVKKFEERTSSFYRRCLFIGTANVRQFLGDQTGERRWLPTEVSIKGKIELKKIKRDRNQLWAEGAARFFMGGVDWSVEKLARVEHDKYKIVSPWADAVAAWLNEEDVDGVVPADKKFLTATEVLQGAINLDIGRITRKEEMEVGKVLARMGYEHTRVMIDGSRSWRWKKAIA